MAASADALGVVTPVVVVVAPVEVPLVSVGAGVARAPTADAGAPKVNALRETLALSVRPTPEGVRSTVVNSNRRPETSRAPFRTVTRLRSRYRRSVSEYKPPGTESVL